jgi:tetratricopeptide (TPR) repeat protein
MNAAATQSPITSQYPSPPADLEPSPRTTHGPAWHRRVHGLHVVSLQGTFEEMGRQHGALLSREIRRGPIPYYRTFTQKMARGAVPAPLAEGLRVLLRQTVGRSVQKQLPPYAIETMRGLADGAGLPFEEVLDGCVMPDTLVWLASRVIQAKRVPPAVKHRLALGLGCTSAIAWGAATRDGKLLHARNFDYHGVSCWPSTAAVLFHTPAKGQRYVAAGAAGVAMGGITAMNEAGLSLTVHQHMFTDRARLGGSPIGCVGDEIMREARSLDDAEAILGRQRPTGCWTYLVADGRAREVLAWEENPDRNAAIRVPTSESCFGYANVYLDRALGDTERDLYPTYWRHNQARHARANELLRERSAPLDAAGMGAILADVGDARCRLRDSIAMTLTVGSVVFRPEDGVMWLGSGEAPTSHGTFIPFSLAKGDHAPEHGTFTPGDAHDARMRDAFEHWRRTYVAYVDHDDLADARKELAMACALAPEQPAFHAVAGLFALQAGDARDAIASFDRAIALGHPDAARLASFHLWRARAADVAGDRAHADRDYRAVLASQPDPMVFEAAKQGLRKPYDKRRAARLHVEMSLGDVMAP